MSTRTWFVWAPLCALGMSCSVGPWVIDRPEGLELARLVRPEGSPTARKDKGCDDVVDHILPGDLIREVVIEKL